MRNRQTYRGRGTRSGLQQTLLAPRGSQPLAPLLIQQVRALYQGQHADSTIQAHNDLDIPGSQIVFTGTYHHKDGHALEPISILFRYPEGSHLPGTVYYSRVADNDDILSLQRAAAWHQHWQQQYPDMGIHTATMRPNRHGTLFWVQQGWTAENIADAHYSVFQDYHRPVLSETSGGWASPDKGENILANLVMNEYVSDELAEQADRINKAPADQFDIHQLAELGREAGWKTRHGEEMWLGKMLLSGTEIDLRQQYPAR